MDDRSINLLVQSQTKEYNATLFGASRASLLPACAVVAFFSSSRVGFRLQWSVTREWAVCRRRWPFSQEDEHWQATLLNNPNQVLILLLPLAMDGF